MLNIRQFRQEIIKVALEAIELYSPAAEELVLGTALVESRLTYIRQVGGGPALGLWQMEPATHLDIWANYLVSRPQLKERLHTICHLGIPEMLIGNMWYGAAMCRIHYRRVPTALPMAGDIESQAAYWKQYYNTPLGAGTAQKYIDVWQQYMEV